MNYNVFDQENSAIKLDMPDADVIYYPLFLENTVSDTLFQTLLKTIAWKQDRISLFGKTHDVPRLTALYSCNNNPYRYSGITMHPKPFTKELLLIKNKIETLSNIRFTSCLLNLYRDGKDSNGWHADDEKELGTNPVIASVSLGHERWFHFRHKKNKPIKSRVLLQNGSLLLMKGATQANWLHQIPKTKKEISPRINLTFRIIQ